MQSGRAWDDASSDASSNLIFFYMGALAVYSLKDFVMRIYVIDHEVVATRNQHWIGVPACTPLNL
jgi:hypothetical protein